MNPENIEKHKWKEGESGNPSGRPVGSRNRATIVKEWLEAKKKAKNPLNEQEELLEVQDMITLAVIGKALKGDVNAYKELMDSAYGKLLTTQDITTKGDKIQQLVTITKEEAKTISEALENEC